LTIDTSNPDFIWVSPEGSDGDGSWERPFESIKTAIDKAEPGKSIILKQGTYTGDLTIEISGSPERPVRIIAEKDGTVEIANSCWFLYDTSDLIISGLTFKDSPTGALSVVGSCNRNLFQSLRFSNCGSTDRASCTMYFGGTGGECNLIENCVFEGPVQHTSSRTDKKHNIVALMISGGSDTFQTLKNYVVRKNRFSNYDFSLLVGSHDSPSDKQYGHIIEYNTISNCKTGIIVRCSDILIKGNKIENCSGSPVTIESGAGCIIESNRMIECQGGIQIHDFGHSIINNCIIRCKDSGIDVCGKSSSLNVAASNLFIENNTCIDCGLDENTGFTIRIEPGTTSIIRKNLLFGKSKPYSITESIRDLRKNEVEETALETHQHISDNICNEPAALDGFSVREIVFLNSESDDFQNETGYGAQGWMLRAEGFNPDVDEYSGETDYLEASILEDEEGELIIPGKNGVGNPFASFYSEMFDTESVNEEE